MADRKISQLTALTTPASGDFLPIVDISEAANADKNKRITIEELMRGAPDGTAAAPSIAFESDPNTGIYSPGADAVGVTTGGTERMRIDSAGNVGIGTSSPGANSALEISGNQKYLSVTTNVGAGGAANPSVSNALHLGWNRSNGDGESNIIYGTGLGGGPGLEIASWDGTTYTSRVKVNSAGNVGIGTNNPTTLFDVNADTMRLRTARTPASAGATGAVGEICWDTDYIYICTATNTWKRAAISTW